MQYVSRQRHRGFTLVEVGIVLAAFAIIAPLLVRLWKINASNQRGYFIGQTMAEVHTAAEDFARKYRTQIIANATGTPTGIAGVVSPLAPSLNEFLNLGHLNKSINPAVPRAGDITISYGVAPPGCVPSACSIQILSYINGAVLEPDVDEVAVGVLAKAMETAGSKAGRSDPTNPAQLHGTAGQWSATNPVVGNPVGVLAMLSSSSDIGMDAYVRVQDTRNPDLQGSMTVAGAVTHSGTTTHVGQTTMAAPVVVNSTLSTVGAGSNLTVGGTANITGRVNAAADVFVQGVVRGDRIMATGSYAVGVACSDDGAIAKRSGAQGVVACLGGSWQSVLTISTIGAACAPNGADGQDSAGVKLMCVNGTYRALSSSMTPATVGDACVVHGQVGYDFSTAQPSQLVCRANPAGGLAKWMRIQDITTHMVFITAWDVTDGVSVDKPHCSVATGQTVTPIMLLRGKSETSSDSGFSRYAIDNGTYWTVVLQDAAGSPLGTGLAETFCFYN